MVDWKKYFVDEQMQMLIGLVAVIIIAVPLILPSLQVAYPLHDVYTIWDYVSRGVFIAIMFPTLLKLTMELFSLVFVFFKGLYDSRVSKPKPTQTVVKAQPIPVTRQQVMSQGNDPNKELDRFVGE